MGLWAGIKYALNSTLGTSNFKSLDKIIEEKVKEYTAPLAKDVSLTGVGKTIYSGSYSYTGRMSYSQLRVVAKFIAPVSGLYKINGTNYGRIYLAKSTINNIVTKADNSYSTSGFKDLYYVYKNVTVNGSINMSTEGETDLQKSAYLSAVNNHFNIPIFIGDFSDKPMFYCFAGEPVVIFHWYNNDSNTTYNANITITYGND